MANLVQKVKDELTFENVVKAAMQVPGVKINRKKLLEKELIKYCTEEQIQKAIRMNPAMAGISKEVINKVSLQVINYETTKVTGLSVAASVPGGAAAVGAAAADITSYFAFIIRTAQELAYLYGFSELDISKDGMVDMDSETMNYLLIFIGVMFGVQGAASTLQKIADSMAKNVSKRLAQKALTKGTIYPIVKKVAKLVGVRMTKQIFADTVASAIPILGGALSGGLTYAMFKPGCLRLRKNLMDFNICDPDYYNTIDVVVE